MVEQFHRTFRSWIGEKPAFPPRVVVQLRQDLIREEFLEFERANIKGDLVAAADALADLAYVVYGAAVSYGIDLDRVIAEVHRSNMTKLDQFGDPIFRSDGKVMKGPDYQPPDIESILADQAAAWQ